MSQRQQRFSRIADEQVPKKLDQNGEEYASDLEAFIDQYLAPEVLSNQGRVTILLAWLLLTVFSLNGAR